MLRQSRQPQVSSPSPKSEPIAPGRSSGCGFASSFGLVCLLAFRPFTALRQANSASSRLIGQSLADHTAKQFLSAILVGPSVSRELAPTYAQVIHNARHSVSTSCGYALDRSLQRAGKCQADVARKTPRWSGRLQVGRVAEWSKALPLHGSSRLTAWRRRFESCPDLNNNNAAANLGRVSQPLIRLLFSTGTPKYTYSAGSGSSGSPFPRTGWNLPFTRSHSFNSWARSHSKGLLPSFPSRFNCLRNARSVGVNVGPDSRSRFLLGGCSGAVMGGPNYRCAAHPATLWSPIGNHLATNWLPHYRKEWGLASPSDAKPCASRRQKDKGRILAECGPKSAPRVACHHRSWPPSVLPLGLRSPANRDQRNYTASLDGLSVGGCGGLT